MAVVIVTRFKGNQDFTPRMKQAAGILKKHGAKSVRGGRCHAGAYAGQVTIATAFSDWTSYGKGMDGLMADPEWQAFQVAATKEFELQDRSLIAAEDF